LVPLVEQVVRSGRVVTIGDLGESESE